MYQANRKKRKAGKAISTDKIKLDKKQSLNKKDINNIKRTLFKEDKMNLCN